MEKAICQPGTFAGRDRGLSVNPMQSLPVQHGDKKWLKARLVLRRRSGDSGPACLRPLVHRKIIFYKTIEGRQKMAETKQGEQQDQSRIKTLVILTTDSAGKGNDDLGRNIVTNFIKTMKEMGDDLWRLVLLNGGVKLAVEGAEVLPQLQALAHEGLDILVCEGCLKTFGLLEKKRVGEVTNMLDIVTSMQVAEKVISFA